MTYMRDIHDLLYLVAHRNRKMAQLVQDHLDKNGMSFIYSVGGIGLQFGKIEASLELALDEFRIPHPPKAETVLKDTRKTPRKKK